MTALERIREYARRLIADGARKVDEVGKAGAHDEVVKAEVGIKILALLEEHRLCESRAVADTLDRRSAP